MRINITPRKLAAQKANAAKSTGPNTPEGKTRSSVNAFQHGIYADNPVVHQVGETDAQFLSFRQRYVDEFLPNGVEMEDLVQEVALCRWRLERNAKIEAAHLDSVATEIYELSLERDPDTGKMFSAMHDRESYLPEEASRGPKLLLGKAGATIEAANGLLTKLSLVETRLVKRYEKAMGRLNEMKALRAAPDPLPPSEGPLKNEPKGSVESTNGSPQTPNSSTSTPTERTGNSPTEGASTPTVGAEIVIK